MGLTYQGLQVRLVLFVRCKRQTPRGGSDISQSKIRLDHLLVQMGLVESREKAKALIMAGEVTVNGFRVDKAGHRVSTSSEIILKKQNLPYVSRGGLKLEAALEHFSIQVKEKTLLDIGASTGGFTDCLLQHGAGRIIAVDVGYGQIHWKLRQDHRVRILERTNARTLNYELIGEPVHGAVVDVSFISLRLIMPQISRLLGDESFIIALIKPQFEVGKQQVGKGGVVRDPALHREVVDRLSIEFTTLHWCIQGCIPSPVQGPKGNQEYLMYMRRTRTSPAMSHHVTPNG